MQTNGHYKQMLDIEVMQIAGWAREKPNGSGFPCDLKSYLPIELYLPVLELGLEGDLTRDLRQGLVRLSEGLLESLEDVVRTLEGIAMQKLERRGYFSCSSN